MSNEECGKLGHDYPEQKKGHQCHRCGKWFGGYNPGTLYIDIISRIDELVKDKVITDNTAHYLKEGEWLEEVPT